MRTVDFINYLNQDRFHLQAFCEKYGAQVVNIIPNTEDSPSHGLLYIFDNQSGGFSIEGIKSSLEEKVSE